MFQRIVASLRSWVHWLFETPVKSLPPIYGDTVPTDLRTFAAQAEEAQHHGQEIVRHRGLQHEQTKVPQGNVPIERL